MPYIIRDDGEHFVIPSYRDTLRATKPGLLKREIMLLATNYGDYAALQKKGRDEFEIAFSTEFGYLLGETVWAYFNRPKDLVYCEAIPNTTDAILVIVKGGSVYLDGSFPVDSIPEELVIFKTQQNEFDVHIYGDVPLSETPEKNKFSFDASSVHSFAVLEKPIFQTLPIVKAFQLQLIDVILKQQGIGVFPIKPFLIGIVALAVVWGGWELLSTSTVNIPISIISVVSPYQVYVSALSSPSPTQQVQTIVNQITLLTSIPGWSLDSVSYADNKLVGIVRSKGALLHKLFTWANYNNATVAVSSSEVSVTLMSYPNNRPSPAYIYEVNKVITSLVDRFSYLLLTGNPIAIKSSENKGQYIQTGVTISFADVSLSTLALIGERLSDLPLVLSSAKININDNVLSGSLELIVLGK